MGDPANLTAPAARSFRSCGVRIDAVPLATAVDEVLGAAGPRSVHLCNAHTLSVAARDPDFSGLLNGGSRNFPDGAPLVWIGRSLGLSELDGRVYGPELMSRCLDRGRMVAARHYLFGSTESVLAHLVSQIDARWPGVLVVGAEAPPFGELSDTEIADAAKRMDSAGAQIVWVGLGTPKQDQVVERLVAHGAATYVAIGAAFDFIAGTKRQAPAWVGKIGLEWMFRLLTEPRRLWKRYLVGNTLFLWHNLRSRPRLVSE